MTASSKTAPDGRTGGLAVSLSVVILSAGLPVCVPAQTIDTVVVHNRNIFDLARGSEDGAPGFLARLANALHIRTRASVIHRSLLISAGEPYDSARVAESERALRGLGVFRQVVVDTTRVTGGERLAVRVVTADGWSTKPQANFSTAGGDATWEVGLVEENFLGTATELAATYRQTPDRQAVELLYLNPHFLSRRAVLSTQYFDRSDGRGGAWRFGLPFYQTAARRALETDGEAATERVLVFRDGALVASPQRRALRFSVTGGIAPQATSRDYLRLWVGAQWRREDFAPETTTPFPRSTFATVGAGLEVRHVRFRVLEHFNSYARREDVDLSQTLRVGIWAAPRAWGYPRDRAGVGPEVSGQLSAVWRGGFTALRAEARGVVAGAGLDSGRVRGQLTFVSQNLPRQTAIVRVEGGALQRVRPGEEFDLWIMQSGPRVFGAHAFTGTRMVSVAVEHRVLVVDELWGLVGLGVAPFFDWGGAWYADQAARLGGDAGLALRLGPTRSIRGGVTEFAVGYRFGEGFRGSRWAVAVRNGLEF